MENSINIPKGIFLVYNQFIYPIIKSRTRLGRHGDNDLVLTEDAISRFHAEILYDGRDFVLYDMGSSNGTRVNNRGINKSPLKSGTIFYLADVAIVFVQDDKKVTDSLQKDTGELK